MVWRVIAGVIGGLTIVTVVSRRGRPTLVAGGVLE